MYSSRAAIERANYYSDSRVISAMTENYSYLKKGSNCEVDFEWIFEIWQDSDFYDGTFLEIEEFKGADKDPNHKMSFLFEDEITVSGGESYYELKNYCDDAVRRALFLFWLSRKFSDFADIKNKDIHHFIKYSKSEYFSWPTVKFQTKFEVCPVCDGRGVYTNPSIDCGGISSDEWSEWDYEEREYYMSGGYDQKCSNCNGERVVLSLDESSSSSEFKKYLDDIVYDLNEASYYDALERANELRFGC